MGRLSPEREDLGRVEGYVSTFSPRVKEKLSTWQAKTTPVAEGKFRAVVWGSGSKGVAFLINSGLGEVIEYVVDINPHRQGMFMPGTGQEIVGPDRLKQIRPDMVIVMNRIYEQEIREAVGGMGLLPDMLSL